LRHCASIVTIASTDSRTIEVQEFSTMSLTRLITWMSGVSAISIRALPPMERLRLANECRRLLMAAEPQAVAPRGTGDAEVERTVAAAREAAEPAGVLARLQNGERAH
jgi:hypothetical protein